MPSLASMMSRRAPDRLGDLAALGFNPALSPSLASLMASAGSLAAQPVPAPGSVPAEQAPTTPNPRGIVASAQTQPRSLGDLNPQAPGPNFTGRSDMPIEMNTAPVNVGADPYRPANGAQSLGDLNRDALGGANLHRRPDWGKIAQALLGITGDGLMAYGGLQPQFGPNMARQNAAEQDHAFDLEKLNRELEVKRQEKLSPRVEQVGDTIGWLDPSASTYKPIYSAPSPAEDYANALGLVPGTDQYHKAVQDYRMGAWSDPAVQARLGVLDHRFDRSDAQLGQRLDTTRRGQDLRYRSTTRGQDLTHGDRQAATAQSNTNNLRSTATSAANNSATNQTRLKTARRVHAVSDEPVAVGPNGERMVVRNGQWVPAH